MMHSNWKKHGILLALSIALSSCASVNTNQEAVEVPTAEPEATRTTSSSNSSAGAPDSPSEINRVIEESNPVLSDLAGENDKVPLQIPIEINRRVESWIKYFTVRERKMTTRYLERGEPLRPHIEAILKENEVPPELYYLAMIESGFVTSAKSRAKAVGVWQFVTGTGKNYKMTVNSNVDERRNWIKATEAAANYLKDLHNVFGSWYLALAAYNAGEYKIVRSIMKGKTRDFWVLAERGLLPKETMDYVPKFLAAQIVGRSYAKLGFKLDIGPEDHWEPWETFSVPSGVKLTDLSKKTKVSLDVLKRWNRDLIVGITPFSKTGYVDIYMPKTEVAKFEGVKEELASLKRHQSRKERLQLAQAIENNGAYDYYIVRRGDNLGNISKRIGTSARTLMKINGLRRGRIHPGQRLKYYSNPAATEADQPASQKRRAPASKKKKRKS